MAKQVKIADELHEALSTQKSDTGVSLPIGATAERAIQLYLNQHRLNALIMKAYQAPTLDAARHVLKYEVATLLGIPEEYLFSD